MNLVRDGGAAPPALVVLTVILQPEHHQVEQFGGNQPGLTAGDGAEVGLRREPGKPPAAQGDEALGNGGVARVGSISRMLLPTDGLWRGAMHALQDPTALTQFGRAMEGFPFLSQAPLTATYLAWTAVWVVLVGGVAATAFVRKDL